MSTEEAGHDALLAERYEIGPVVGKGSTATVHRARDLRRGDTVAVKLFSPTRTADDGRDRREIAILTGLRHPGLVTFRDAGTTDDRLFVVMDLVEGRSLAEAVACGPLPAATVVRLGAELADALAYVHARSVVHRDIKPANVLIDVDDRPRLADFGLARIDGATRMTSTGAVVGTAAYMAPEQVRGREVSTPADIYSLGLTLLEAATGRREYPGAPVEAAVARLHRPPVVPDGLPPQLDTALRRMTTADPDDRPSAANVAELLRDGPALEVPTVRTSTRRLVLPLAALAALVAAIIGGSAALRSTGDSGVAAPPPSSVPSPGPTAAPPPAAGPVAEAPVVEIPPERTPPGRADATAPLVLASPPLVRETAAPPASSAAPTTAAAEVAEAAAETEVAAETEAAATTEASDDKPGNGPKEKKPKKDKEEE